MKKQNSEKVNYTYNIKINSYVVCCLNVDINEKFLEQLNISLVNNIALKWTVSRYD